MYERHRPEQTLLYQLIERHYPAFQTLLSAQGNPLPIYVQQEFEAYLKCGPCYISGELADYLQHNGMGHTRGRPYHPQTQGKIERWHRSMKNHILLNHYYLPGELKEHL